MEISSRHDMLCNIIPKSLNRATLELCFWLLHERTPPRYQVSASIGEKSLLFFIIGLLNYYGLGIDALGILR